MLRRRTPRGTGRAATADPSGRAGSCACRAVRPRVLPFPPLGPPFMPPALHLVKMDCGRTLVRARVEELAEGPGTGAVSRSGRQVRLPARLEETERQAEPVGRGERLACEMEPRLLRRAVHLLGVASPARGHDVLPDV